jgi:hypothetical protein
MNASGRGKRVVVWGVWLAMLAAALLLVAQYGSNVPSWDDWDMVPVLTRNQPLTLDWLWSQHNEHRVPLPRLLFLLLNRLTMVDFRVTMYFDVLAMAAVAAGMIVVATRLRGRPSLSDAFFPILLLNWGHAVNLLWGWQIEFFVSVVLACAALLAIVQAGATLEIRRAGAIVGACTVLLPLCGANGLGMAPALALWPLALALLPTRWTGVASTRGSRLLIGLGVGAFALTLLYFVRWEPVPHHPKSRGLLQTLETSAQFITIGLGPATRGSWPLSGIGVIILFGLTGLLLLKVWRERPAERGRAGGLALFVGALTSLALGLGLGRNGFETRYVTLAIPAWCWAYLVWDLYGSPARARNARGLLALAALAALWPNTRFGATYAADLRATLGGFEADMMAGVPIHELARRYDRYFHPHQDIPLEYLPMLRAAGVGRYGALRDDPPFREVPISLAPTELREVRWSDSTGQVSGSDPFIVFSLPSDRYVAGIRLKYRYHAEDGSLPYIGVRWKRADQPSFSSDAFKKYSPTGDRANWERGTWTRRNATETTLTVWLSDTIGQIGITPNFVPGVFRITELSLLVPEE